MDDIEEDKQIASYFRSHLCFTLGWKSLYCTKLYRIQIFFTANWSTTSKLWSSTCIKSAMLWSCLLMWMHFVLNCVLMSCIYFKAYFNLPYHAIMLWAKFSFCQFSHNLVNLSISLKIYSWLFGLFLLIMDKDYYLKIERVFICI